MIIMADTRLYGSMCCLSPFIISSLRPRFVNYCCSLVPSGMRIITLAHSRPISDWLIPRRKRMAVPRLVVGAADGPGRLTICLHHFP